MFTLTQSSLGSYSLNNDIINNVSQAVENGILTGGVNSMSERKILAFNLDWTPPEYEDPGFSDLYGASLYINFSFTLPNGFIWTEPGGPPASGFNHLIHNDGLPYSEEMNWYSNAALFPQASKNYKCTLSFTGTSLLFTYEYFNGFDEYAYLNSSPKDNEWRFLSEKWDQQNFNTWADSYYHTPKQIRATIYIVKNTYTEKQEVVVYQGQANTYDTPMTLSDFDDNPIIALSTIKDNEVKAVVGITTNTIEYFYAKLIKIQNDQTVDFITNYALQENLIDASNITDNAFKGPFSATFDTDHYNLEFLIDKDFLELGKNYRIIIVAYNEGTGTPNYTGAVNYVSISQEIATTAALPYCYAGCETVDYDNPSTLELTGSLIDLNNEYLGNELTCVIEERLRSKLIVNYSDDRWKNNLTCRSPYGEDVEVVFSNDIRRYLSYVTCEIYTEYNDATLGGEIKNQLEFYLMQRNSASVSFTSYVSSGIVFNFDTVNEILTMYVDFRNRDEFLTPCLSTTKDGSPFFPLQDNQYWGGKDIFIKWSLYFYYDDFPGPFIDKLDFVQKLHVQDYTEDITIVPDVDKPFICPSETICYTANHQPGILDPETYNLINTIEPVDSGGIASGNLKESEEYAPPELTQQQDDTFFNQDETFAVDETAQFCVDPSELTIGQDYKISVIAKKQ